MIPNIQFVENNPILSVLLQAISDAGLPIPPSPKLRRDLIARTELYLLVPSGKARVASSLPLMAPQQCAICHTTLLGCGVSCWYRFPPFTSSFPRCTFAAHPACLLHSPLARFLVDRAVRVVVQPHPESLPLPAGRLQTARDVIGPRLPQRFVSSHLCRQYCRLFRAASLTFPRGSLLLCPFLRLRQAGVRCATAAIEAA